MSLDRSRVSRDFDDAERVEEFPLDLLFDFELRDEEPVDERVVLGIDPPPVL